MRDLREVLEFIKTARERPNKIVVTTREWVRIRRDIERLSPFSPTTFASVAPCDRWLWNEHRKQRKLVEIQVLGVPVERAA